MDAEMKDGSGKHVAESVQGDHHSQDAGEDEKHHLLEIEIRDDEGLLIAHEVKEERTEVKGRFTIQLSKRQGAGRDGSGKELSDEARHSETTEPLDKTIDVPERLKVGGEMERMKPGTAGRGVDLHAGVDLGQGLQHDPNTGSSHPKEDDPQEDRIKRDANYQTISEHEEVVSTIRYAGGSQGMRNEDSKKRRMMRVPPLRLETFMTEGDYGGKEHHKYSYPGSKIARMDKLKSANEDYYLRNPKVFSSDQIISHVGSGSGHMRVNQGFKGIDEGEEDLLSMKREYGLRQLAGGYLREHLHTRGKWEKMVGKQAHKLYKQLMRNQEQLNELQGSSESTHLILRKMKDRLLRCGTNAQTKEKFRDPDYSAIIKRNNKLHREIFKLRLEMDAFKLSH